MNHYRIENLVRISKPAARKAFNAGAPVFFCPVNLRPGWPWHPEILLHNTGENFEAAVAAFEFYNCTCRETGKYAAFYIEA